MDKYKIPLFDEITNLDYLFASWDEFRQNKKTKADVALFASRLIANLSKLEQELKNGTYQHGPYYHFKISDPKPRDIHKATVKDRIVHHVLYRALYPYFAQRFIYDSYSCQLGKETHRALRRLATLANRDSHNNSLSIWILKGDVKKCFASIDHNVLKKLLTKRIKDQKLLDLLNKVIDSFRTEQKVGVGIPLGNLTSQLFVNIYLNEFDQFVKHQLKEKYYIRYADNFVILGRDKESLEKLISMVDSFLANNLKLTLHPTKVFIKTFASGVDFLGWVHFFRHRTLRTMTKKRMFKRIKEYPTLETISSYLGLLRHGNAYKLAEEIESRYD